MDDQSESREVSQETLAVVQIEGGAVHVRVRRKKRGHVSEKNQIWARKRKGGCHMGDQCGRRSRDQGKQGWEYLSMTVSTLHHKSFLETRNKVI